MGNQKKGPFHLMVTVRDIDQAIKDWQAILSVVDPEAAKSYVHYYMAMPDGTMGRWATFNSPHGCEIQLGQMPNPNDKEMGHHICYVSDELEELPGKLAEQGIALMSNELTWYGTEMPWQYWTFIAPGQSHGVMVELAYPYRPQDGKWVSGRDDYKEAKAISATGQSKKGPAHICLVVRDIDQAIKDWQAILSVVDPEAAKSYVRYDDYSHGGEMVGNWVTFNSPHGCEIQLAQPLNPDGVLYKELQERGEFVHHICYVSNELEQVVLKLDAKGVALTSKELTCYGPEMPWQYGTFIAPEHAHGVLVELAYPYRSQDGKWVSGRELA